MNSIVMNALALMGSLMLCLEVYAANDALDSEGATVCMDIAVSARIRGLEDFELETQSATGSEGARYSGSDYFELETNAPVRLMVSGGNLRNSNDQLITEFSIDNRSNGIETSSGAHIDIHELRAVTELGDVSDQLAGTYSSQVRITVVPLVPTARSCERTAAPQKQDFGDETVEAELSVSPDDIPSRTRAEFEILNELQNSLRTVDKSQAEQVEELFQKFLNAQPSN